MSDKTLFVVGASGAGKTAALLHLQSLPDFSGIEDVCCRSRSGDPLICRSDQLRVGIANSQNAQLFPTR
ncbi:MAG: hypothetical protein ACREMA_00640 [Longimicrobiales bacterium]